MKLFRILIIILCFSCQNILDYNTQESLLVMCQEPEINFKENCQLYIRNFEEPNLAVLQEGIDYIIIDPSLNPSDQLYSTRGFTCCSGCPCPGNNYYNTCCGSYYQFTGADKTWDNLLLDKLKSNPNIKYVLFKPGDYRCLGPLCISNRNSTNKYNCSINSFDKINYSLPNLYLSYFDNQSSTPFLPTYLCNNIFNCDQVIFENIVIRNSRNIFINGILFDGIQTRVTNALRQNIIKDFSDECTFSNCLFQNHFKIAVEIRSSNSCNVQNCIFRNSSHCMEDLCGDPIAILIKSSHPGQGSDCDRVNLPLANSHSTLIINNLFYNIGQAVQSVYGGPNCIVDCPDINCPQSAEVECNYAGIDGSVICGNKSFRSDHSYSKYENHYTFKIGSQNELNPVILKYNYCEKACPIGESFCGGNGIGSSGQGLDLQRFTRNVIVFNNVFNNLNYGIQGKGLYGTYCVDLDNLNWNLYFIENYFDCIQPCSINGVLTTGGAGINLPIYCLQNTHIVENCFINCYQPIYIEDYWCEPPNQNYPLPNFTCI